MELDSFAIIDGCNCFFLKAFHQPGRRSINQRKIEISIHFVFQNLLSPRATVDVVIIPVEAMMSTGWPLREATEDVEVGDNEITNANVARLLHHPNPCPLDLVPIHKLEEQEKPR